MGSYQAPYDLDSLLNELPVSLENSETSNNAKMLQPFANELVNIQKLLERINCWRDIDQAQGKALDMIGEDHGVYRNGANDAFYRFEIKVKRLQRVTDGTYNSLLKLLSNALNVDASDIYITSGYENSSQEPDAISVTNIPDETIDNERKKTLVLEQLQQAVAAGVRVDTIEYQTSTEANLGCGTAVIPFNFVEIDSDVDTETIEREVSTTTYMRATQTVQTNYEIESEEVKYG